MTQPRKQLLRQVQISWAVKRLDFFSSKNLFLWSEHCHFTAKVLTAMRRRKGGSDVSQKPFRTCSKGVSWGQIVPGLWIRIHFFSLFFTMWIRIQLLFKCGSRSGSSFLKIVKKLPYEDFSWVEKDKKKHCSKGKNHGDCPNLLNFL